MQYRLRNILRYNALLIMLVVLFTACSGGKLQVATADNFSFSFSDKYWLLFPNNNEKPKDMKDDVYVTALRRLDAEDSKLVAVPKSQDYIIILQLQNDQSYTLYESLKLFKESELLRLAETISALYADLGYKMADAEIAKHMDTTFFHIRGVSEGDAPLAALEQYTTIIDDSMLTLALFSIVDGTEITKEQSNELLTVLNTMVNSETQNSSSSSVESMNESSSSQSTSTSQSSSTSSSSESTSSST